MGQWFVGKIEVYLEDNNGKLPFKSTFQYSTIPCMRHKKSGLKNTLNFSPALAG